ncbi:hypothetical protein DID76_00040 [Candidatus Marinamargulisbacteria bacterium SCGC AG-414-C22]|nr:hypothetical protein DID76_00040 [Candidatus Marinamargulisbacteria bacterium SCGC AG-414-C22]
MILTKVVALRAIGNNDELFFIMLQNMPEIEAVSERSLEDILRKNKSKKKKESSKKIIEKRSKELQKVRGVLALYKSCEKKRSQSIDPNVIKHKLSKFTKIETLGYSRLEFLEIEIKAVNEDSNFQYILGLIMKNKEKHNQAVGWFKKASMKEHEEAKYELARLQEQKEVRLQEQQQRDCSQSQQLARTLNQLLKRSSPQSKVQIFTNRQLMKLDSKPVLAAAEPPPLSALEALFKQIELFLKVKELQNDEASVDEIKECIKKIDLEKLHLNCLNDDDIRDVDELKDYLKSDDFCGALIEFADLPSEEYRKVVESAVEWSSERKKEWAVSLMECHKTQEAIHRLDSSEECKYSEFKKKFDDKLVEFSGKSKDEFDEYSPGEKKDNLYLFLVCVQYELVESIKNIRIYDALAVTEETRNKAVRLYRDLERDVSIDDRSLKLFLKWYENILIEKVYKEMKIKKEIPNFIELKEVFIYEKLDHFDKLFELLSKVTCGFSAQRILKCICSNISKLEHPRENFEKSVDNYLQRDDITPYKKINVIEKMGVFLLQFLGIEIDADEFYKASNHDLPLRDDVQKKIIDSPTDKLDDIHEFYRILFLNHKKYYKDPKIEVKNGAQFYKLGMAITFANLDYGLLVQFMEGLKVGKDIYEKNIEEFQMRLATHLNSISEESKCEKYEECRNLLDRYKVEVTNADLSQVFTDIEEKLHEGVDEGAGECVASDKGDGFDLDSGADPRNFLEHYFRDSNACKSLPPLRTNNVMSNEEKCRRLYEKVGIVSSFERFNCDEILPNTHELKMMVILKCFIESCLSSSCGNIKKEGIELKLIETAIGRNIRVFFGQRNNKYILVHSATITEGVAHNTRIYEKQCQQKFDNLTPEQCAAVIAQLKS